jgi:hypothetical protein
MKRTNSKTLARVYEDATRSNVLYANRKEEALGVSLKIAINHIIICVPRKQIASLLIQNSLFTVSFTEIRRHPNI